MLAHSVWFAAGLALLIIGSEIMVRGGAGVAARLGISPIIIGLTIVSIGTSAPELAVGVVSAQGGSGALAVGNIAGTNIVNILLILGLSAFILPLRLETRTLRLELPMMAAAALTLWAVTVDERMNRTDGAILVVLALVYTGVVIWSALRESRAVVAEFEAELAEELDAGDGGTGPAEGRRMFANVLMTIGGIVVIVIGADWLVDGAVGMARQFGVSEALIGLTVVAIGTSAPELVTTLISTIRGDRDIAVGNLIGSSIYNILLILGVTALVPAAGMDLPNSLVRTDIPIMVAVALACIPIFISGRRVSRLEGGLMVAAYLGYLAFLLSTQT